MTPPHIAHLRSPSSPDPDHLPAAVQRLGGVLETFHASQELLDHLVRSRAPEVVVIDRESCDGSCRGVTLGVRTLAPEVVLVVRLAAPDESGAWWLVENGVADVLSGPGGEPDALARRLRRWLDHAALLRRRAPGCVLRKVDFLWPAAFDDPCWSALAAAAGSSRRPILVEGEPGTGKSRLARRVHDAGGPGTPFVEFRPEGLPEAAIQGLLFRPEDRARDSGAGAVERARGGTLLVEEVAALPPGAQLELLGRLEAGGRGFRLIATTSVRLEPLVRARRLSSELYGLLAAMRIELPPLRERRHEIPSLVARMLAECRATSVPPVERVAPDALRALMAYSWPGNLRELEDVVHRAVGLAREAVVTLDNLPEPIAALGGTANGRATTARSSTSQALKPQIDALQARAERHYLHRLLIESRGQLVACAQRSGISRRCLLQRLRRHGLDPAAYQPAAASESDRQLELSFPEPLAAEG